MADRVEWLVIPEPTTRLLALERGEVDVIPAPPAAIENDALAPRLARSGFKLVRAPTQDQFWFSFNLRDPAIGGTTPANIALRRALAMAIDDDEYVRVILNGSGRVPRNWIPQDILGHDPLYVYPIRYEPATANALLDRFGYSKRVADGYRRGPDGRLTLTLSLRTGGISRETQTLWKKNMDAVGLRTEYDLMPFQEIIKNLEKGKFQMYQGGFGGSPSGYNVHAQLHGRQPQRVNTVQFHNADYDRAADQFVRAASDEEQIEAVQQRCNDTVPV